ncbi:hypothetical protein HGRIS_010807 [Hohenbuehelia grisea]|uniref:Transcription factor TFIIIC triple barrel domain-containing protein n=1 Tax=Hohenbuehelia grisea TaxID=104357 RepID=A0ABR3IXU6_9AGAR
MSGTPSTLIPGFRQVASFGPDSDYEEGEEVMYVTMDLGPVEPTLVPSSSSYRLIGLDTPSPFLQLSGTVLKGRHDSLIGTEIIFSDGKDGSSRGVQPIGATEQRIQFKEVTLKPKATSESTTEAAEPSKVNEPAHVRAFLRDDDELLGRVTGEIHGRTAADADDEKGKGRGRPRTAGRGRAKSTRRTRQSAAAEGADGSEAGEAMDVD